MKEIKYSKKELVKINEFAEEQWNEMEARLNERVEEEYGRMGSDGWLEFRENVQEFLDDFSKEELFEYIKDWGEDNGINSDDITHEFNWSNFEMEWGMP